VKTFTEYTPDGPAWNYVAKAGDPITIPGPWEVEFIEGGPELPESYVTGSPASWTKREGNAYKNFSGTARYSTTFQMPDIEADDWVLDLGNVHESARVFVNGEELGALWAIPFRMNIGDALQAGENTIDIEVTNLGANRIAELDRRDVDWKIFYDINYVSIEYKPFDASEWEPMPSGLTDPVVLIPMKSIVKKQQ
jgi:hypothetical protein